jgi:hypothetical protein
MTIGAIRVKLFCKLISKNLEKIKKNKKEVNVQN